MNATTDYILFLDCDDQYYPNAINDFLNTNKNHDYDLIISRFVKTLNGEKQRDFMNYKESVKDINKVIAQNG
jgi:glycosyltransferase involved in cell wall biosynthesis